jgi:glycerol kinase
MSWKEPVSESLSTESSCFASDANFLLVVVAGSAIKWLRDSMKMIKTADEINTLARSVTSTSGVYFVTAFSGLLAPYWDPGATGLLVGLTSYTTPAHIARAALEANAFRMRAVIDSKLDSKSELTHL